MIRLKLKLNGKKLHLVLAVLLVCLFAASNAAYAHTGLKSSVPEKDQIVKEAVRELKMTFNTVIEPVSKFEVVDEKGVKREIADLSVSRSSMTGTLESPLENGTYTVNWSIIGEDGHRIKGSYAFQVDAPAVPTTPSSSPVETAVPSSPAAESSPQPASPSPSAQQPAQEGDGIASPEETPAAADADASFSWLFLGLAVVVLIIFAAAAWRKRNRSR